MSEQQDVLRPVAIVTGGTRGIGRGIARRLAAAGYDLVLTYHSNREAAEETRLELADLGVAAVLVQADVSEEAGCEAVMQAAAGLPGRLEALVNNAGINRDGLLVRMDKDQFEAVLNTDLVGPFLMIKAAAKVFMKNRHGRIVNISSVVGLYGNAGQANYSSAKAGLIGLTKTVAKELASRNITCNAIAPGFIDTDMTRALPEKVTDAIKEQIAQKRFGRAEDVAAAVNFFVSEEAGYITGQVLEVAGGLMM